MTEWKVGDIGRLNKENIGGARFGVKNQLFLVSRVTPSGSPRGKLLRNGPGQHSDESIELSFWVDSEKL